MGRHTAESLTHSKDLCPDSCTQPATSFTCCHDITTWCHHMMWPHDVTTWCQHSSWVHVSFLLKMFFIASMKKCFLSTWQKKSNYFISHVKKSQFFSPEQKKHHIQIRRGSLDQLPSHQAEQTLKTVSTLYKMSLSPRHILIILYN